LDLLGVAKTERAERSGRIPGHQGRPLHREL